MVRSLLTADRPRHCVAALLIVISCSSENALTGCRNRTEESTPPKRDAGAGPQKTEAPKQAEPEEPAYSPKFTTGETYVRLTQNGEEVLDARTGPEYEPAPLVGVVFDESEQGAPEVVGCADGQREAFADIKKFPQIAGCIGSFVSSALDNEPSGVPCGDDLKGRCNRAADVCADGWHVCGTTKERQAELIDLITPDECDSAGPGRFNAGISHTRSDFDECEDDDPSLRRAPLSCTSRGYGAEPVCCGSMCEFGLCRDGVWMGRTRISRGVSEGCAELSSERNPGVLCCMNARSSEPE